jgi:transcriptional regulator with XRE-family HTH domain
MKSYKEIEKKYKPEEIAESYIFPNDLDSLQRAQSLEIFQNWRKNKESNRSTKSKLITKLLQLKFVMEDYIMQNEYKEGFDFSYFLVQYISRLEIKKKEFAQEIDVDPTELSQIINKHRSPNEKFIIRLEIHSNKNFPAIIWFKVIEKERTFHLQNDTKLRQSESKHVRSKVDFTF